MMKARHVALRLDDELVYIYTPPSRPSLAGLECLGWLWGPSKVASQLVSSRPIRVDRSLSWGASSGWYEDQRLRWNMPTFKHVPLAEHGEGPHLLNASGAPGPLRAPENPTKKQSHPAVFPVPTLVEHPWNIRKSLYQQSQRTKGWCGSSHPGAVEWIMGTPNLHGSHPVL